MQNFACVCGDRCQRRSCPPHVITTRLSPPAYLRRWFKLYDECGQADDCDENESIVYLEWAGSGDGKDYVDWYVAVEPIEPEMTQLTWVWADKIEGK